jgi:pimeloyl-ACP methyl ester carboxylesterase
LTARDGGPATGTTAVPSPVAVTGYPRRERQEGNPCQSFTTRPSVTTPPGQAGPAALSEAELDTYLTLIKGSDRGRAFLRVMRSSERTAGQQARYRAAVRDVPYPVQGVWAADDPTMTLAAYGEKARAAAGLPRLHVVPGKHFPQEDQAPAIAQKIAELVLGRPPGGPEER